MDNRLDSENSRATDRRSLARYPFDIKGNCCFSCKKAMVEIVRLGDEDEQTSNTCFICINKDCMLYINLEEVKTWEKK